MPGPMNYDMLVTQAAQAKGMKGEKLEMKKNLIRVHRDGHMAMAYFTTHRTQRAGGAPVDESFENIHVWVRTREGWRLMGGMARPVPKDRASLSSTAPAPAPAPEPAAGR